MTIRGKIIDSESGFGIPYASIVLVDANGQLIGQGIAAANDGSFGLTSSALDNNLLLISATGYGAVIADPSLFAVSKSGILDLVRVDQSLPDFTVTAFIKNPWFLLGLVALGTGIGIAVSRKVRRERRLRRGLKKGRIGEAAQPVTVIKQSADYSRYVLPVAVVVGGYLVLNPLLQKLGLTANKQDRAQDAAAAKAAADQQKAAQSASGSQSYSDSSLNSIAAQIPDTTKGLVAVFGYDYKSLVRLLAYFSGFRYVDAVKFLGFFATINGFTLYRWWYEYFQQAVVIDDNPIHDLAPAYASNFRTMGIPDVTAIGARDFVNACVSYVYKVAKTSLQ